MLPNKIYFKKMIEIIDNLATMSIHTIKSHFKKQYGFFLWPPFILFIYFKRIFVTNLSVKISVIFLVKIYARVQTAELPDCGNFLQASCGLHPQLSQTFIPQKYFLWNKWMSPAHYVRFSQFYWHFEILNRKMGY